MISDLEGLLDDKDFDDADNLASSHQYAGDLGLANRENYLASEVKAQGH